VSIYTQTRARWKITNRNTQNSQRARGDQQFRTVRDPKNEPDQKVTHKKHHEFIKTCIHTSDTEIELY